MLDFRNGAILKTYLYTGVRLATACRLRAKDFHQDGQQATFTINEKGNKHRTIGIHFAAAEALSEYITKAGLAFSYRSHASASRDFGFAPTLTQNHAAAGPQHANLEAAAAHRFELQPNRAPRPCEAAIAHCIIAFRIRTPWADKVQIMRNSVHVEKTNAQL